MRLLKGADRENKPVEQHSLPAFRTLILNVVKLGLRRPCGVIVGSNPAVQEQK